MPENPYDPDHNPIDEAERHTHPAEENEAEGDGTQSHSSLQDQEVAAASSPASGTKNTDDTLGKGYSGKITKDSSKREDFRTVRKAISSRKKLAFAAGGGFAGIIALIVLLIVIASSLQLTNLAQNITNYEMARMSRQFASSAQRVTDESLAIEGASDPRYTGLRAKYEAAVKPVKDLWGKFDKYRPAKVMANMKASGDLKFNYGKTDILGRPKLTSVTLKGITYDIAEQGNTRFIPGLNSIIQFKNGVSFASDFQPALNGALRSGDIGPITRWKLARDFRAEFHIGLVGWNLSKFKGKDSKAARVEETRQRAIASDEAAGATTTNNTVTENLSDAVNEAAAAEEETLASDQELQKTIDNGGIMPKVQAALNNGIKKSGFTTALGVANQLYGTLMPLCIVYDGSLDRSGPTIDKQVAEQVGTYHHIASGAAQQQRGTLSTNPEEANELASAVKATNADITSSTPSNAEAKASGYPADTSNTQGAEQSAGGSYTLLNVLVGSNTVADSLNTVAGKICSFVTNTKIAVGGAIENIGIGIVSLGTSSAAEEAAGEAASQVVEAEAKSLAESLVTKYVGKTAGRITGLVYDTGKGTVKSGIKIAAATVLAKLIVNARAGQLFSGAAQGKDLADQAAAGGNLTGNELERVQEFGRPLLMDEVCASNKADRTYISANFAKTSPYNRYLNTHDANSLVSRTAIAVNSTFNGPLSKTLLSMSDILMRPFRSFGMLINTLSGVSYADTANCNGDSTNYGNVQFGWSEDEEKLKDNYASYGPIENQEILSNSGQEAAIAQKYSTCFGYSYNANGNGNIDPTDKDGNLVLAVGPGESGSLGTLISTGAIVLDAHANVVDHEGLCAPSNLSYNSPDALAIDGDGSSPKRNDMIFRWRLAMRYGTTIDQQLDVQNATLNL